MKIHRVTNPDDVAKLYPWLVPTETETRMDIACELMYRLDKKPDDTFILVAIERDIARAVLIAYVSENSRKRVWLWQSHAVPGFSESKTMFDALKEWTKSKGAREIRMGAQKHHRVFQRRWGFKPCRNNGEMGLRVA